MADMAKGASRGEAETHTAEKRRKRRKSKSQSKQSERAMAKPYEPTPAEPAFNKLARTLVARVEALKRYRTGGEQMVTVQHVNVNEGGQAIVGAVSCRPGGGGSK